MTNTRRILLIVAAVLVAVPMWVNEIQAQTTPYGSPPASQGASPGAAGTSPGAAANQIEGKIASVDPSGKMVTLDDATQLMIPPTLSVQRESLKEGAIVKANFEERNGQKVATSLQVTPGN